MSRSKTPLIIMWSLLLLRILSACQPISTPPISDNCLTYSAENCGVISDTEAAGQCLKNKAYHFCTCPHPATAKNKKLEKEWCGE